MLRNKYRYGNDILSDIKKRAKASNAWRGINKVWPYFKNNLIWRVGNGQLIKIWTNYWLPGIHKLGDLASIELSGDL